MHLRNFRNAAPAFETLEVRHLLAADLIVSEFVARNSGELDADGDTSDWIEVFNQGDTRADLGGWYLTDDAQDLNKWRFPLRRVEPGQAIVVFASGKNRTDKELHTNFRLSGSGEYLALVAPDSATIATEFSPTFPAQIDEVSYGVPMEHVIGASVGNETPAVSATLVSHFTFDNPSQLGDDIGTFNNDATAVGNARFSATSKLGAGALFLDGNGDFLQIANSGADYASIGNDGDGFTISAWVNVDSVVDGNRRLFSLDMEESPFKPRGWGVGLRDENTLLATTYGRVDFDEPSGGAIEDGDWRHLAYVFNPIQGSVEFFIDGVSTGKETDAPIGIANSRANDDYLIGALNLTSSGNGQFFRGLVDDIRIYDGPLTQSEVGSIMSPSANVGSTVRFLVPQDDTVDSNWMRNEYDDASWSEGAAAIGYQINPAGIGGVIEQTVPNGTRSVYLRTSFEIDDAGDVSGLLLRMKYDDGFVVYINGNIVETSNAPNSPRFDSVATTDRDNSLASEWAAVDLSSFAHLLVDGTNTLAIHALNDSVSSNEFLVAPDLIVVGQTSRYLIEPTPAGINSTDNDFGPLIEQVAHAPPIPRVGQDITVTARVSQLADPVSEVILHHRVMYDAESAVRMNDAGNRGDAVAGDGVYTAIIPARTAAIGQMVRYYVTSQDASGREMREPFLPIASDSSQHPEYLGTVIHDPRVVTDIPVFQWFVPDPTWHMSRPGNVSAGNNRSWTSASAFFDGEFYDNIQVRTRGSATVQDWPKPKFKFEFNDVHEFRYSDGRDRVDEFNLQSHYIEVLPGAGLGSTAVSYMRETLAYEFLQDIGVPVSTAFHMRVQQNGKFYALASFIEQVDQTFLRRNGFDDEGAMYKATPTVQSTLASNPNPDVYRKVTQKDEPFDDLRELTDGIDGRIDGVSVEQYLFDNINLPQVINEMAGQVILMNHDRLTKNYYMYKDVNGSGEWSRFPWDVEQSFSDPQWEHFASVLYGDSEHTQGTGNEPQYQNHLHDAILDTPRTRQMFLERVRTLIDTYLGVDGPGYFERRIDELAKLIAPDARLDHARWSPGGIEQGVAVLKQNIRKRREALANDPFIQRNDLAHRNIHFGAVDTDGVEASNEIVYNPISGNQDEEYISIINTGNAAVDMSGWRITGGIEVQFQPGTVLAPNSTLYVTPDVNAFRARTTGPSGLQSRFVQATDSGHLSNFGETLTLINSDDISVASVTTPSTPSDVQTYLRVSEIHYNPLGEDDTEFVELVNISEGQNARLLDLSGATISDGPREPFVFSSGTSLGAGQRLVVVSDAKAFRATYENVPANQIAGEYVGQLSNSGEQIKIDDANGGTVLQFYFSDTDGWPAEPDGAGPSLELRDVRNTPRDEYGNPARWISGTKVGGTPTVSNEPGLVRGDFTADGFVDGRDIDRLFAAIRNRNDFPAFDLNGDTAVDQNDVEVLLNEVLQIPIGDSNVDGIFNSTDFVLVFQANEYEDDLAGNSTWSEGDWDGDGDFTTTDFVSAFRSGLYVRE